MRLAAALVAVLMLAVPARSQDLGSIDFPTSGSPAAQPLFIKGVLLMHSFEYDDAREAFVAAQQADPNFAMAYWGEAMTFNHPVWQRTSPDLARTALNKLAPLPDAKLEANEIARVWGGKSAVYTGAQAREETAKTELTRARIVHFAAHGLFDDDNPMFSQIVLATSRNSREDGTLQAWEMMRLDLNADLVVLSACETARGRIGAGEGLIGLGWAAFMAGSASTIVSQWKVDSQSTADLMIAFHRALQPDASGRRLGHSCCNAKSRIC